MTENHPVNKLKVFLLVDSQVEHIPVVEEGIQVVEEHSQVEERTPVVEVEHSPAVEEERILVAEHSLVAFPALAVDILVERELLGILRCTSSCHRCYCCCCFPNSSSSFSVR